MQYSNTFFKLFIILIFSSIIHFLQAQPTIRIEPVTYGQRTIAPLASGTSHKLFDWDGDGLTDVIMYLDIYMTRGKPRLIWSRNLGTATSPLFTGLEQCPVLIKHSEIGYFAISDFDGDGISEIVTAGGKERKLLVLRNNGTPEQPEWEESYATGEDGEPFVTLTDSRSSGGPTLAAADLDGDGKPDLLMGTNHPSDPGMRKEFGTDTTVHSTNSGRVYWARNLSTAGQIRFSDPEMLTANGQPIKCFAVVYPAALDFDYDGHPDLLLGDHKPGVRLFRNQGAGSLPDFEPFGMLNDDQNQPIASLLFTQWDSADLNGNGHFDLVTSTHYGSANWFYWLRSVDNIDDSAGWYSPTILPVEMIPSSPLIGPGISTPTPVDFNGDGVLDLLLGSEPGVPMIALNIGTNDKKIFTVPKRLRWIDGSFIETYSSELGDGSHHGALEWYSDRVTPRLADWDGDGVPDIISGTQGRRLYWMKGRYVDSELRFEKPRIFTSEGQPLLHPHRFLPAVIDWDGNGQLDIVAFLETNEFAIFPGNGTDELGEPIPLLTINGNSVIPSIEPRPTDINKTNSGRAGIDVADWNGDGLLDLITAGYGDVLLYLQAANGRFEEPVRLISSGGHLGGPSVIDWNGDGHLDILFGGDYGHLCGAISDLPTNERAHYYVVHGKSLSVPSVKSKSTY